MINSRASLIALAAALVIATPALAQNTGGVTGGGKGQGGGTGGQDQGKQPGPSAEQFQQMKTQMLKNHQTRATIIQQGMSCIQAAGNADQLRTCIQNERMAEEQLREQIRAEMPRHDRRDERDRDRRGGGRDREDDDRQD